MADDDDDDAPALSLAGAFTEEKTKQLGKAKENALLKRIVRITAATNGKYTVRGQAVEVESFSLFKPRSVLHNYGCSVAVSLYLSFQVQCAGMFVVMFLLAIPSMLNNARRSDIREACRAYNASSGYPEECGWGVGNATLPIQQNLTHSVLLLSSWASGTCQEFTTHATSLLPIAAGDTPVGTGPDSMLVHTQGAGYCEQPGDTGAAASYWASVANVLLFFLFLISLRRTQRTSADRFDRALWTTGDYSVLISGLDRDSPADENSAALAHKKRVVMSGAGPKPKGGLEERVYHDLAERGFSAADIVKVEVARECATDQAGLEQLKTLRVREQELLAKQRVRTAKGKSPMGKKMSAEWDKLQTKKSEVLAELGAAKQKADVATGHAFVTFLYEVKRNQLVAMCRQSSTASLIGYLREKCCGGSFKSGVGFGYARGWTAAPTYAKRVRVQAAPEPDDVKWENMYLDLAYQRKQGWRTFGVTVLLLVLALLLLIACKVSQASVGDEAGRQFLEARIAELAEDASLSESSVELAVQGSLLSVSMLAALLTTGINLALKSAVGKMTVSEARDTTTEYETSLFGKLSLAYTFNTVLLPIAVGMVFSSFVSGTLVTQSWFEPGGVVNQAFFLMLTNAAVTTIQVVQPGPLLQRYCFARLVVSQHRLNQLWAPPDMLLGELYASTIKTVALCLVYAPLWPPAYIVTALALLLNYVCTKFAVAYWYRKPPMVSEEMMTKLRSRLGLLMLLHTVVAYVAANAASSSQEGSEGVGAAPVSAMFAIWLLYELVDAPDCLNIAPCLKPFDEIALGKGDDAASHQGDTLGIPYRRDGDTPGVRERLGYDVDEYMCPSVTKYPVPTLLAHAFRDFVDDDATANKALLESLVVDAEPRGPPRMSAAAPEFISSETVELELSRARPNDDEDDEDEEAARGGSGGAVPPYSVPYDDVAPAQPPLDAPPPPMAEYVARGGPVMSTQKKPAAAPASTSSTKPAAPPTMGKPAKKGPPVMSKKGPPVMSKK